MLLKLLKYDFRAMWKQFSLIWGAALALALVNRFTLFRDTSNSVHTNSDLLALAFIAVIVAMFVIGIGFVINRFSKGLLGNEGYLMHTLPVRPWQLVASKLICGVVTWVGCGVVAILSPIFMLPFNLPDLLQFPFWSDIFRGLMKHPDMLVLVAETCLVIVSFLVVNIAAIYLAISVGHLFPRHRRLLSVAAFIGLYILLVNVYNRVFTYEFVHFLLDITTTTTHGSMLTAIAVMLIPAAVFLAAVCWILEHKLNLE
ncbi:hypothetical protein [Flintibacter muris]|uniref:hypothetical protein n=1 Tax=Flintibacter muris TaxID=2941327 RepID=UPI00203E7098|nr:hypothetical protein [Flintibacter muris]